MPTRFDASPGSTWVRRPATASNRAPRRGLAAERRRNLGRRCSRARSAPPPALRSEEHTSELQSPMRISYAVFCLEINEVPGCDVLRAGVRLTDAVAAGVVEGID